MCFVGNCWIRICRTWIWWSRSWGKAKRCCQIIKIKNPDVCWEYFPKGCCWSLRSWWKAWIKSRSNVSLITSRRRSQSCARYKFSFNFWFNFSLFVGRKKTVECIGRIGVAEVVNILRNVRSERDTEMLQNIAVFAAKRHSKQENFTVYFCLLIAVSWIAWFELINWFQESNIHFESIILIPS